MEKTLAGDRTVGKLIKWLRVLGIPCERRDFKRREEIPPHLILLTRNRRLASEKTLLIPYDHLKDQLLFVFRQWPELKGEISPFSLCLRCNKALIKVEKEEVFGLVPEYIYENHDQFRQCPSCKRIYWRGSHLKRMETFLKEVLVPP